MPRLRAMTPDLTEAGVHLAAGVGVFGAGFVEACLTALPTKRRVCRSSHRANMKLFGEVIG
jgi:hypothetical protein